MKAVWLAVVVLSALGVGACNRPWEAAALGSTAEKGRFSGVGIYPTGQMWAQTAGVEAPKSAETSRLKDDQEVIVVVDTRTGELRQCGNTSGFCVGMNPWAKPLPVAQTEPLSVLKHEEELELEHEGKPDLTLEVKPKPKAKPKPAATANSATKS